MLGQPTYFWAKLELGEDDRVTSWHPLIDHCADVSAVFEALFQCTLLRDRLARLAGSPTFDNGQVSRLCVLSALHDIGKFNIGFQNKALASPHFTAGHGAEVLALFSQAGFKETERLAAALNFGELSSWSCDPDQVARLLVASISHHGRPVAPGSPLTQCHWAKAGDLDPFEGMARLVDSTRLWFPEAWNERSSTLPTELGLQHAFAGLVMLSDWLGSDTRFFPFRQDGDEADRMTFSRRQAAEAVAHVGLDPGRARKVWQQLEPTFSAISDYEPRPAQKALFSLELEEPSPIVILEAETGSGKTEAALIHYLRLFARGLVDGMYFALPTRTAATQIHRRVVEAVERSFPDVCSRPPVILAVPGYLAVDDAQGRRLPHFEVLWQDDEKSRFRYRGWAAENPKRYLAGAVVVGTIDQVLLSTLQVPHSHMRASTLLRQLLVIDEVHASDSYMSELLESVLGRHISCGGHALLMSATLGAAVRQRLLAPGTRTSSPTFEEAVRSPYPCIVNAADPPIDLLEHTSINKQVDVELRELMGDPQAVADFALLAAAQGAKVLVLRNTVTDCRATQVAVETIAKERDSAHLLFECNEVPAPHHARFAGEDRKALDEAIEDAFGKSRASGGCVAVATQTVQQSLDLDADLLVTDLCPMDVLLQRVGRLHRHARERPCGYERARLIVLTPPSGRLPGLIRSNGEARGPQGLGTVYDDLRIIEATRRVLSERSLMMIPRDCRLLVEGSLHPEVLTRLVEELGPPWDQHATKCAGGSYADRRAAHLNLARWDVPFGEQQSLFPSRLEEKRISTRLGEEDRVVYFKEPIRSPFGALIRDLHVPAWWTTGIPADAVPAGVQHLQGVTTFSFGPKTFVYDRLGLRPRQETAGPNMTIEEDEADA